jgi:hypothetical protein
MSRPFGTFHPYSLHSSFLTHGQIESKSTALCNNVSDLNTTFAPIVLGDNDLGLAVIERWTHHFIENYHKRSNHRTTLEQSMVSPFENKNILMARVGIKDDFSLSKFKNTKLTEFFGAKGGGGSSVDTLKQKDTIVDISPESLLNLPSYTRSIGSKNQKGSEPSTRSAEEATTNTCSAKEDGSLSKLLNNGFYILICGLIVALFLSNKFEKLFFRD